MSLRQAVAGLRTAIRPMSSRAAVVEPEVLNSERLNAVRSKIIERVSDTKKRLFAVVYINDRQFKVSQDDIIHLHHNVPLDVGDNIKLEKVLLVGGSEFSLIGRPLLSPDTVTVNATVIEKTTTSPELDYTMVNHKKIQIMKWLSKELTVLRINDIVVKPSALGTEGKDE